MKYEVWKTIKKVVLVGVIAFIAAVTTELTKLPQTTWIVLAVAVLAFIADWFKHWLVPTVKGVAPK